MIYNLGYELWIQLNRLRPRNWKRRNAFFVLLTGGPGAGKGTVAAKLAPRLDIPILDFGALIRAEMKAMTEFGKRWKPEVDAGRLIPDSAVLALIFAELDKPEYDDGAVIDGLRTKEQAMALRNYLAKRGNRINIALFLDCPEADLIVRLSLRRTCSKSGCKAGSYHLQFNPPKVEGKCDLCNSDLIERADQTPEAIKVRFGEFHRTYAPLREYLEELRILRRIVSTNDLGPDHVYEEVLFAIDEVD